MKLGWGLVKNSGRARPNNAMDGDGCSRSESSGDEIEIEIEIQLYK
jgi:hypothetical protein